MEDNRKGTWVDVTEDCGTRPASDDSCLYVCYPGKGYVRALLGKHGIYGHCVEGGVAGDSPNARGYRLARPTADTWAIEHFTPEPEWVDVTDECVAEVNARRVSLMHNGICVALMGHQVNTDCGTLAKDYRVTTIPSVHNTFSGFLKVERRND